MTQPSPIEDAYSALCFSIASALQSSGFVADADTIKIDPPEDLEPEGDASDLLTAAAIVQGDTKPVQTFMGGPAPRYVVEREVNVELAAIGPKELDRKQAMTSAVTALCEIPGADATLGSAAEGCEITDQASGDLPPNGLKRIVTFVLRVRAGDPLGLTPA